MEKSYSTLKRLSSDSSKRSLRLRGSRSTRTSRESKDSRVSMIKEEQIDADQTTNYRESIVELFFESFYATLIVEKKSMKPPVEECHGSSTIFNPSLDISSANSFISFGESGTSEYSSHSKEGESQQRLSTLSSQSATDSTGTNISCLSTSCPCCFRVVFRCGNVYEGQMNDLLMEGKGTYYWRDGAVYKGEFKDGYPNGQGKLTLPDLSTYEGDFCWGFFHGNGNFNLKSSPLLCNGEWKISKRNGKGWMLYEPDNWYEGDWLDNKKHGQGFRRYANGDKYKGSWLHDKISGEGCMMWHNNDYYNGEWSEGQRQGYGEYTWGLIAHNNFAFPNYNWYQGNWVNGLRTGAGIMNFGHESGAKYAGTWQDNKKNGPGVMICGNGITLEKNPLFTNDKPSAFVKDEYLVRSSDVSLDNKKESVINVFKSISRQILSRENLGALNKESVMNITRSGTNIKMKQYIKLLDKKADNPPPLKIPIHNVIHEVDLEYFVGQFTRPPSVLKDQTDMSAMEIEHIIKRQTVSSTVSGSCMNFLPSNTDVGTYNLATTASQQCLPNINELKNLIINYLPQLRKIYKRYASLCVDHQESLTFEPMLIRMFLWQLYRDIGVTDVGGVSIVEVDEMLMKNPNSCLETTHNPWEQIYFWQFLQSLVGVACLLYQAENHLDYTPSSGFMFFMFKDFLERKLLNHAGIFQGNCLTHLRDLIPIDAMYRLYKEIGEPHTVDEFLKNICLKKGETIPCYKLIRNDNNHEFTVLTGTNIVILNNEPSFLEKSQVKINADNSRQKIYEGMYTFSSLGHKKILRCLYKICPQILSPSGKYQLTYRLSFIEFYEAVLLMAFEKVEQERLAIIEDFKAQSASEAKGSAREMSRASTHSARRKKFKK